MTVPTSPGVVFCCRVCSTEHPTPGAAVRCERDDEAREADRLAGLDEEDRT